MQSEGTIGSLLVRLDDRNRLPILLHRRSRDPANCPRVRKHVRTGAKAPYARRSKEKNREAFAASIRVLFDMQDSVEVVFATTTYNSVSPCASLNASNAITSRNSMKDCIQVVVTVKSQTRTVLSVPTSIKVFPKDQTIGFDGYAIVMSSSQFASTSILTCCA
jgi:hypothetical protein